MAGKDNKNNYSETSSKIKKIRYAIVVIFVIFIIFAVFSYREDLTVENFRYLMKYVNVKPITFGNDENAQINFEPDSSTVTSSFKEDLVVASKTAVKIYDLSSKEILSDDVSLVRPVISTSDKYFAVYDLGAKYFGLYNSFSKLWEKNFDYPIYDVAIDDDGSFLVATASKGYTSALMAYNSNFKNTFNWRSADKYILSADIFGDEEKYFSVGTVRSNTSGEIISSLVLLSATASEPIVTLDFEGELVMKTAFTESGRAIFVTDKAIRFVDLKGKLLKEEFFSSKSIIKFEAGKKYSVVLINDNFVGKNHRMIIFDDSGNTYMENNITAEITDLAVSDGYVFILGVEDVTVIDIENKKIKSYPSERSYRSVERYDDENVYLVYDGLAVAMGVE